MAVGFVQDALNFAVADEKTIPSGALADVPNAFANLPTDGAPLKFAAGAFKLPAGGHLQGLQMRHDAAAHRNLAFLSHDSLTVASLIVVEFPADHSSEGRVIYVHPFPSDGQSPPLRHAGGMQLAGTVLAVGLEDNQQKTRSEVQFWDTADPKSPQQFAPLTIRRAGAPKEKTAGAVGLVRRENDYLLAVANWDSRAIDFYAAGKALNDPQCRFEPRATWQETAADKSNWQPDAVFAAYQAVNLVADGSGSLYLLGFATDTLGKDIVDLFALDLNNPSDKLLRKLASKRITLVAGNHFSFAAGAWIEKDGLSILASARTMSPVTTINILKFVREPGRAKLPLSRRAHSFR